MNRKELLERCENRLAAAIAIMEIKNKDYTGSDGNNPFANFEFAAQIARTTPELYILGRIAEKLSRASNLLASGEQHVLDEGLPDTFIDQVNYTLLVDARCAKPTTQDTE